MAAGGLYRVREHGRRLNSSRATNKAGVDIVMAFQLLYSVSRSGLVSVITTPNSSSFRVAGRFLGVADTLVRPCRKIVYFSAQSLFYL
jgi:hypothetical protein